MSEGKYAEELHRRICELPDEEGVTAAKFVKIASEVASEHPLQYERFRIHAAIIKLWRRWWK